MDSRAEKEREREREENEDETRFEIMEERSVSEHNSPTLSRPRRRTRTNYANTIGLHGIFRPPSLPPSHPPIPDPRCRGRCRRRVAQPPELIQPRTDD